MQRVSLDFTGTIFPHAICLGDAENDSVSSNWWWETLVGSCASIKTMTVSPGSRGHVWAW
uniref:Uncharacterized protein n=1 Tax=Cyprinus carpio TaxID=7962 RepID=A0A8C1J5A1_CYPCA